MSGDFELSARGAVKSSNVSQQIDMQTEKEDVSSGAGSSMSCQNPAAASTVMSNRSSLPPTKYNSNKDQDVSTKATATAEDFVLLGIMLLPSFVQAMAQRMSIPVMPIFAKQELAASPTMIGTLVAAMGLGKLVCNIPSGWLVSLFYSNNTNQPHKNGKIMKSQTQAQELGQNMIPLALSCLILASAYIAAGFSTTSTGFLLARLCEGAGLSLWIIGRQTILNDLTSKETRGRYMSTLGGVSRMAAVVGPLVGGMLASYSLRWSFWCQAFLSIVNALILLGIIVWLNQREQQKGYVTTALSEQEAGETEDETEDSMSLVLDESLSDSRNDGDDTNDNDEDCKYATIDEPSTGMSWAELLSQFGWTLMTLAVFGVCMSVVRESRHLLFPLLAMEIGYDAGAIGIMTGVTFLLDSSMFPMTGYLMDHHGRRYSGIPANLIMGLSLAAVPVLAQLYPTSLLALTLASAGCGMGNGLSSGLLMSLSGDTSPPQGQDRAKFLALFRTFTDGGLLLGPWISGLLADHFSLTVGFEVQAGVAVLGAVWMAFMIPETCHPVSTLDR